MFVLHKKYARILLLWLAFFVIPSSFAAGYQLYELGTPIMGTAGVGQAAVNDDASASYFNPAVMPDLDSSQVLVGGMIFIPKIQFSKDGNTTISGNNGGKAGVISPGLGSFFAYRYSPNIYFGINLASPAVGILDYSEGWVGRYSVQNTSFLTIGLNPSLALKVNEVLSVGAGFTLYYSQLEQTIAVPLTMGDGQIELDNLQDYSSQFNLGFLLTIPNSKTKVGLMYRTQSNFNLKGEARFLRLATTPSIKTQLKLPQNIIVSIKQPMGRKFNLLIDGGWGQWSVMQSTPVRIGGFINGVTPRNFKDTWRAGVGGQYQLMPNVKLQAGFSYDSSPTTANDRLPDLALDQQKRFGIGTIIDFNKHLSLASSYEYSNLGKARINSTGLAGVLSGYYSKNYAHFIQISINGKLDSPRDK